MLVDLDVELEVELVETDVLELVELVEILVDVEVEELVEDVEVVVPVPGTGVKLICATPVLIWAVISLS